MLGWLEWLNCVRMVILVMFSVLIMCWFCLVRVSWCCCRLVLCMGLNRLVLSCR